MRDGLVLKMAGGPSAGEIRTRRCLGDLELGDDAEVVELTFEAFTPHWLLTSLTLTTREALELGFALVHEAALPMNQKASFVNSPEAAV